MSAAVVVDEDGRRLRRGRNRDAVVDAMLDLLRAGNLAPSSTEIAARAGLSPRSVFRYFDDIDDLCRAAIARQHERIDPLLELAVGPDAPFADRVTAVVEGRVRLFEAMGQVGVVIRVRAPFQPLLAAQLTWTRAHLRLQLERTFAPELATLGAAPAADALAAADVVSSFESYQLLRDDQLLTRARATDVLTNAVTALLGSPKRRAS